MTDTAGYSDQVFGLFRLLGLPVQPPAGRHRLRPLLAHHPRRRLRPTERPWPATRSTPTSSRRTGTTCCESPAAGPPPPSAPPSSCASCRAAGGPPPLGRAVAELGRITKTFYLLAYLDDETYRRRILTQLNRTESRHALARAVFHGQRGQLRQRYREGQEDQLGALGLVINAIVLWNTRYQDAALDHLRRDGHDVRGDDVRRLSPLGHDHINLLGRYQFSATDLLDGSLRPLRDPATPET